MDDFDILLELYLINKDICEVIIIDTCLGHRKLEFKSINEAKNYFKYVIFWDENFIPGKRFLENLKPDVYSPAQQYAVYFWECEKAKNSNDAEWERSNPRPEPDAYSIENIRNTIQRVRGFVNE